MSSRRSKYAQEAAEADDLDEESSALVYIKDEIYGYIPARIVYMTEDSYEVGVIVSIELPFPREQWLSELSINQSNIRPNQDISIESGTERDVLLQDYPNMKLPLQNKDYQYNTLYNLRNLEHLNEASILYALKGRYLSSEDGVLPYTRCGSSTIVAFNPFKFVSSLYIDDVLQSYTPSAEAFKSLEKDGEILIEPHVVEIATLAYKTLKDTKCDQSIVATGVSGSGKTEAMRFVLYHLVDKCTNNDQDERGFLVEENTSPVLDQILITASDPLFEAFGNCMTKWNDNSSRFAKLTQLHFDMENSNLMGATFSSYLLDVMQLVHSSNRYRSFHVFYALLASPKEHRRDLWPGAENVDPTCFRYLGATKISEVEEMPDDDRFDAIIDALDIFGVDEQERNSIMLALCIVLQLGNIVVGLEETCEDSVYSLNTTSIDDLGILSELMGINDVEVLNEAFTTRTVKIGRNTNRKVKLVKGECIENRDDFAKTIYAIIFDWIVERINKFTNSPKKNFSSVFLLDYFGFETLEQNKFEQICTNYACEKLQERFLIGALRKSVDCYKKEGILAETFDADIHNNVDVVSLFEGKTGIKAVLVDECKRRSGSDDSFVFKIKALHKKSSALLQNANGPLRHNSKSSALFTVRHSSGDCTYDSSGFISSNKNKVTAEWINIGKRCTNKIISEGFTRISADAIAGYILENEFINSFSADLENLMCSLESTEMRHIVCVRPNDERTPGKIDQLSVVAQLKSAGVCQSLCLERQVGSKSIHLLFDEIIERYSCIANVTDEKNLKIKVISMISSLLPRSSKYSVGNSGVYLDQKAIDELDKRAEKKRNDSAILIQSAFRGTKRRKDYLITRHCLIIIQSLWRGYIKRIRFANEKREIERQNKDIEFERIRSTILIQSRWRAWQAMNYRSKLVHSTKVIQRTIRYRQSQQKKKLSEYNNLRMKEEDIMQLVEDLKTGDRDFQTLSNKCETALIFLLERLKFEREQKNKFDPTFRTGSTRKVLANRRDSLQKEKQLLIERERERLFDQNIKLRKQVDSSSKQIRKLEDSIVARNAMSSMSIADKEETMKAEISKRDESISRLSQQLNASKALHQSQLKALKKNAEKDRENLRAEIDDVKEKLALSQEAHEIEVERLFNTLESVEHDRDDMQEQQHNYFEQITQLKQEVEVINQSRQADISRFQKDLLAQKQNSSLQIDELSLHIDELKKKLQTTTFDLDQCQKDLRNNSSEDVIFLRSALNKSHGEVRKIKLEMDALKALHQKEMQKILADAKKASAPCRRCLWQTNMQKAKAIQQKKALQQAELLRKDSNETLWHDPKNPKRSPYDSDSD